MTLQIYIDNSEKKLIASAALSMAGSSPPVADNNTTAAVVRKSELDMENSCNSPADTSRAVGVSSSALLPFLDETEFRVEDTYAVKRRRLSTTGETIYNIQVTAALGATCTGLSMFNNGKMYSLQ